MLKFGLHIKLYTITRCQTGCGWNGESDNFTPAGCCPRHCCNRTQQGWRGKGAGNTVGAKMMISRQCVGDIGGRRTQITTVAHIKTPIGIALVDGYPVGGREERQVGSPHGGCHDGCGVARRTALIQIIDPPG